MFLPKLKYFAFTIMLFSTVVFAEPLKFENIVVFGDSLSDIGNNLWEPNSVPITNSDENGHRELWVNKLTQLLFPNKQIVSSNQAYLNPYTDNISYAWAGSLTGNIYSNAKTGAENATCHAPDIYCVPGLRKQIELYLVDLHQTNHVKPNPKTLFIIWSGGNDIFNILAGDLSPAVFQQNVQAIFQTVNNVFDAKNDLIQAGVSPAQIYIIDLPDFSKVPAAIQATKNNQALLTRNNEALLMSLHQLSAGIKEAFTTLDGGPTVNSKHVFSSYDLFNEVQQNPENFGFLKEKITSSCSADGAAPLCVGYLFFDGKHPTVKVGQLVAERFKANLDLAV